MHDDDNVYFVYTIYFDFIFNIKSYVKFWQLYSNFLLH